MRTTQPRINTCKSVSKQTTSTPFRMTHFQKLPGGTPAVIAKMFRERDAAKTYFMRDLNLQATYQPNRPTQTNRHRRSKHHRRRPKIHPPEPQPRQLNPTKP